MKKTFKTLLTAALVTPLTFGAVQAAEVEVDNTLSGFRDGAPVVLTGNITEIRSDEFDLNYGSGMITVELDGWKWTGNETAYLEVGDSVTVSGKLDDDLFEGREVEADNLYLSDKRVYYYTDDSYPSYYMTYNSYDTTPETMDDGSYLTMRGQVSNVNGDEFTLTSATGMSMIVDVDDLDNNPLDNTGTQIKNGDIVSVYGEIDDGFFEDKEIEADSVILLSRAGM